MIPADPPEEVIVPRLSSPWLHTAGIVGWVAVGEAFGKDLIEDRITDPRGHVCLSDPRDRKEDAHHTDRDHAHIVRPLPHPVLPFLSTANLVY